MSDPFDDDLRELLAVRARVADADVARLRDTIADLPVRRPRARGWLVAAGILLALGLGGVIVSRSALGPAGPAPNAIQPSPTPIAADLLPWVDRCGGVGAGIASVVRLEHARDYRQALPLMGLSPELDVDAPAVIVVYDGRQPFAVGGGAGATAEPLAAGEHDVCVLVGTDAASAELNVYGNVRLTTGASAAPSSPAPPSPAPSPTVAIVAPSLPAQLDAAECEALEFAPDRCLAVVEAARTAKGLPWSTIAAVHLAHLDPSAASLGPSPVARVIFDLADGSTASHDVACGGISIFSLVCTDHPRKLLIAPSQGGGYTDTPCGPQPCGEPGSHRASPVPTIDPAAAASALPLEIASRDVPITAIGRMEVDVGSAVLPNGVLSDTRFSLADPATEAFNVDGPIALEVRSKDPSRPPFDNAYEHGWYPGTEAVEVYIVLDVTSFTPGAQLEIRDLVVR